MKIHKIEMKDPLYIKCDCCCSLLECQFDDDFSPEQGGQFNFTLWNWGRPLSWFERCRWAWRVLTTGNPWSDHTILNIEDAKKLAKYIAKYSKIDCFHDL